MSGLASSVLADTAPQSTDHPAQRKFLMAVSHFSKQSFGWQRCSMILISTLAGLGSRLGDGDLLPVRYTSQAKIMQPPPSVSSAADAVEPAGVWQRARPSAHSPRAVFPFGIPTQFMLGC